MPLSSTGSNSLTFEYTVQSADRDTDGIGVSADAISVGTITVPGRATAPALVGGGAPGRAGRAAAPALDAPGLPMPACQPQSALDSPVTFAG